MITQSVVRHGRTGITIPNVRLRSPSCDRDPDLESSSLTCGHNLDLGPEKLTRGIRLGDTDRHSDRFWVVWLTLNRAQFTSKDTYYLFREGYLASRRIKIRATRLHKCRTWIVWPGAFKNSQDTKSTAIGRSKHSKDKGCKIAKRLKCSEGSQDQASPYDKAICIR